MTSDAFTHASPTYQTAHRTCTRDRKTPVVMPRQMVGHLPDPRVKPEPRPPFFSTVGGAALRDLFAIACFLTAILGGAGFALGLLS